MDQSDEKLEITIRCGRCKNTFKVRANATSVVCACGTTNRIGRVDAKSSDETWTKNRPHSFEKPYQDGQGVPIDSNGFKAVAGFPGRYEAIQSDLSNGVWLDLSRTNLYGFDFKGLTLQSHDLSYSLLHNANFEETKISFVSFSHSDLRGARFRGSECYTSFQYSNLIYADFSSAKLAGSDLKCANLGNANLSKADLTGTLLVSVNFVGALMDGTRFDELGISTAKTYNPTVDFSRAVVEK